MQLSEQLQRFLQHQQLSPAELAQLSADYDAAWKSGDICEALNQVDSMNPYATPGQLQQAISQAAQVGNRPGLGELSQDELFRLMSDKTAAAAPAAPSGLAGATQSELFSQFARWD